MLLIIGMRGLGDNIYQRALLTRTHAYLETPWPELYEDLPNIMPVMPLTNLRTQLKNMRKHKNWHDASTATTQVRVSYRQGNILDNMFDCLQQPRVPLSLPSYGSTPIPRRYAIVRPVTVRAEWRNESRNPRPQYVLKASLALKEAGYTVVSIADLEDNKEWAVEPLPYADITYHRGELNVRELMTYVEHASAVVGGIGWIVPAAQAYRTPSFIICGGQGGYNSPSNVIDRRIENTNMTFAVPDNFCLCTEKAHDCNKRISSYDEQLRKWIADLGR